MGMARLQFYKNKYNYPNFSPTLTAYGNSLPSTPVGISLKNGKLRVMGNMDDFMSCNYVGITRDSKTIYAWIDDVEFHTDSSFYVSYIVDAYRTYRSKLEYGNQFIKRGPTPTKKFDELLGSLKGTNEITRIAGSFLNSNKRYAVVQQKVISGGETFSTTPVQPSPYRFYFCPYDVNDWTSASPIKDLLTAFADKGELSEDIVTLYSIPYINTNNMNLTTLRVNFASGAVNIDGWFQMMDTGGEDTYATNITQNIPLFFPDDLTKVNHSVMLVIPDAGIISVPDELIEMEDITLYLRQDVDIFSGAVNYTITSGNGSIPYHLSVRGSTTGSIPILSDPYDTYISQNQNAITTSLFGDVASIGVGIGAISSGNALIGAGTLASGIKGITNTFSGLADAKNASHSNPPAFLGTALAANFHQKFWIVVMKTKVTNEEEVNSNFGYPHNMIAPLVPPTTGYIQTDGCNVSSDGTVPLWAVNEINRLFDSGILFK